MSGLTIDFRTRLLVSLSCDLGIAIIRNFIESISYTEWLFAICSLVTSMFIVYQTEYSEKIGFLLEETLTSLQDTFDRRAFVSAGLLKAVIPNRLINRLAVDSDQSLIVEEFPISTHGVAIFTTKLKYELIGDTVDHGEKVQEKAHPGSVFASQATVSLMVAVSAFKLHDAGITILKDLNLWGVAPLTVLDSGD
ncbi:hypothetical protein HDU76_000556 [Blyttiomyces sp. JEL0837]|nr:hypothetical protein HDU76_000556 [Blyttiomyces sp. JEL0837]